MVFERIALKHHLALLANQAVYCWLKSWSQQLLLSKPESETMSLVFADFPAAALSDHDHAMH